MVVASLLARVDLLPIVEAARPTQPRVMGWDRDPPPNAARSGP